MVAIPTSETGVNSFRGSSPKGAPSTSSSLQNLDASKLTISLTDKPIAIPEASQTSTKTHTDHLLTVTWNSTQGWSAPQIESYGLLRLSPTASVLHYATGCFEGTKLYRGYDGKLRVFRLLDNCRRMGDSATRISMPSPDPYELSKLIKELCRIEGPRWLPSETSKGKHLYVRPTMIGVDADLECHAPTEILLYVVITYWPLPAKPLPAAGEKAKSLGLKLWANTEQTIRAWPGGSGNKKISANYAPTLQAHAKAQERGFDQVLWLYGQEGLVTEAGGTNFFVIWKNKQSAVEMVTPPLDSGLILPGITRRSVLDLAKARFDTAREWRLDGSTVLAEAVDVVEKDFTIFDLAEANEDGRLLAAFAVGTAYFVRPVVEINFRGRSIHIPPDAMPHVALLRTWFSEITFGAEENEWAEVVEE